MKVGLLLVSFLLCLNVVSIRTVHAQCELGWGEIVSTDEDHLACTGATSDHFTRTRGNVSESWNGTEEFMRWTVKPFPEDDDGYWFDHPHTTSRQVFLSFVVRYGSTWRDRFSGGSKFVMFYNTGGGNPRPTIFDKRVFDGTTLRYRTYVPDLLAGGSGIDSYSYPNHPISGWLIRSRIVSKEQHGNKEAKKKPLLTPKEKKAAKQAKKHAHDAPVFLPNQQAPGH